MRVRAQGVGLECKIVETVARDRRSTVLGSPSDAFISPSQTHPTLRRVTATLATPAIRPPSRRQVVVTAIVYVAYFVLAGAGQAMGAAGLSVVGTAWYFLVAVALWSLFAPADRRVAVLALVFAALGCAVQAVGQMQADTGLQTAAIAFFGLFEIVIGYLITRSAFAPRWLGAALVLAGVTGFTAVFAAVPTTLRYGIVLLSALGELALFLWVIVRAVRG